MTKEFISYIAENPLSGDLIQGTSGIRKIRWQRNKNDGKRGSMRVLYYFYDDSIPIFLLTAYAKNQRANISEKDKKILRIMIKELVAYYKRRNHHE